MVSHSCQWSNVPCPSFFIFVCLFLALSPVQQGKKYKCFLFRYFLHANIKYICNSVRKCRNLGAISDDNFTMDSFVSQKKKCRSASFALHKIGKIRNLIDKHTTERLIHAFVVCHLDFCNSLLSGISARQVQKMQVVQNSAARLIYRIRKHESVFVILRDLHWLHIHSRISFKVCC